MRACARVCVYAWVWAWLVRKESVCLFDNNESKWQLFMLSMDTDVKLDVKRFVCFSWSMFRNKQMIVNSAILQKKSHTKATCVPLLK